MGTYKTNRGRNQGPLRVEGWGELAGYADRAGLGWFPGCSSGLRPGQHAEKRGGHCLGGLGGDSALMRVRTPSPLNRPQLHRGSLEREQKRQCHGGLGEASQSLRKSQGVSCSVVDPMDCSPAGSSVHGILQARIPEWVAIPSYKGSSQPRESNPGLLHRRLILYYLSPQGSPPLHLKMPCGLLQSPESNFYSRATNCRNVHLETRFLKAEPLGDKPPEGGEQPRLQTPSTPQ